MESKMNEGEAPMNDTTRDTANRSEIEELKSVLQQLADTAATKWPQVSDAALALVTALNYNDPTLVESADASLLTALAGLANEGIVKELRATEETKSGLKEG